VSSDGLHGFTPRVGIAPNVGFTPTTPQNDAGRTIEPAVWVPSASGIVRAPTAAADPLDEPAGVMRVGGRTGLEQRELGRDGLADDHSAGGPQPRDDICVFCRAMTSVDRRAVLRWQVRGVDDVLHPDRYAM
jgi:hypothetical protein